jgi:hypothetical protein
MKVWPPTVLLLVLACDSSPSGSILDVWTAGGAADQVDRRTAERSARLGRYNDPVGGFPSTGGGSSGGTRAAGGTIAAGGISGNATGGSPVQGGVTSVAGGPARGGVAGAAGHAGVNGGAETVRRREYGRSVEGVNWLIVFAVLAAAAAAGIAFWRPEREYAS